MILDVRYLVLLFVDIDLLSVRVAVERAATCEDSSSACDECCGWLFVVFYCKI